MLKLAILLILCVVHYGCIFNAENHQDTDATISDVTSSPPLIITAVDGKPVRRASSQWVTVVPVALIAEGEHMLTVNVGDSISTVKSTVTANFEAGKRYQIKNEDGKLSVVEKTR